MSERTKVKNAFLKRGSLLLISILLGVLAALLVNVYIQSKIIEVSGGELVSIICAGSTIPAGTIITEDMLVKRQVPEELLHQKAIEAGMRDFILGQKTRDVIQKGQFVLWTDIVLEKPHYLSHRLAINERAITINVTAASGINGFVKPGDRVDVLGYFEVPSDDFRKTHSVIKVLLQNVTILAVGKEMRMPESSLFSSDEPHKDPMEGDHTPSTVTLKVLQEEASILAYAERKGELLLSLRNIEDVIVQPIDDVGMNTILQFDSIESSVERQKEEGYPVITEEGKKTRDAYWASDNFGKKPHPLLPESKKELDELIKEGQEQKNKY